MNHYVVSLKVTSNVSNDYLKLGEAGYRQYAETMFADVHNRLMVTQTSGRTKAGFTTYKLENTETLTGTYIFAVKAESEQEAAAEAYNWILAWTNTHAEDPEVNVYPYDNSKPLRDQLKLVEPAKPTETLKTQPEPLQEPTEPVPEEPVLETVKRMGRPPLNRS